MSAQESEAAVRRYFSGCRVRWHMKIHHPNCPKRHRNAIVKRVVGHGWVDASIGRAVGISMHCYIRHNLTRYDALLASSVERAEARKMVKLEIEAILKSWGPAPDQETLVESNESCQVMLSQDGCRE